jgi:hypothetical protein
MSTSLLVAKERQSGSPFGLRQKQAKKAQKTKKYGANAPQLHAIRCSIDFCGMLCNETAFNPVQTWLSGFAALCRSTTTVGMASKNTRPPLLAWLAITSSCWHCIVDGKRGQLPGSIACFGVFHQYGVWQPQ